MDTLKYIISGLGVGAAMTIPGVSGGTAAMLLGVYDRVIRAVSRVFSEPRRNIPLLLCFGVGAAAGALIIARFISFLLTTPAEIPMRFFFLGAVAGGIPLILRQAELRRFTPGAFALMLSGAAAVLLLSALPEGLFSPENSGFGGLLLRFLGGVLLAAALVLPGISASHFLYMLGLYDDVISRLGSFDLLPLLPMAAGVLAGTFLSARVLEALFQRHKSGTYLVILGFMLASLRELLPACQDGIQISSGIICAAVGFAAVFRLQSGAGKKRPEKSRYSARNS